MRLREIGAFGVEPSVTLVLEGFFLSASMAASVLRRTTLASSASFSRGCELYGTGKSLGRGVNELSDKGSTTSAAILLDAGSIADNEPVFVGAYVMAVMASDGVEDSWPDASSPSCAPNKMSARSRFRLAVGEIYVSV